jgi:hypothetical protein
MNKVGFWVISYSTAVHGQCGVVNASKVEALDPNIDSTSMHVKAVVGYARMFCMKLGVG